MTNDPAQHVSLPDAARHLTTLGVDVSVKQMTTWESRRARNGFPEPLPGVVGRWGGRVFDFDAVYAWWLAYEPSRGGAPVGNRNQRGTTR